jgi:hypothetical protein
VDAGQQLLYLPEWLRGAFVDARRVFCGGAQDPVRSLLRGGPARKLLKGRARMIGEFVEQRNGGYYVSGTRVSLDSIVYAYRGGEPAESIRQSFP